VRDVLELLAKSAEIILFDTPAVAEEQDTLLLTKYVDGVVLVAEAGRVNREELTETLALLKRNDTPVVALALNKVRLPRLNLRRAPWSREMRNRAHAQQRRQAHASPSIILKTEEL
jgi:Mrp family chromosome partitioning ATPase